MAAHLQPQDPAKAKTPAKIDWTALARSFVETHPGEFKFLFNLITAENCEGNLERACAAARRAVLVTNVPERLGERCTAMCALAMLQIGLARRGRNLNQTRELAERARRTLSEAQSLAERANEPYLVGRLLQGQSFVLRMLGRGDAARKADEHARRVLTKIDKETANERHRHLLRLFRHMLP
jgi:hypothetical protein